MKRIPKTTGKAAAESALAALTEKYTQVREDGFSIDIEAEAAAWHAASFALGPKQAYRRMAQQICSLYREKYGRPFLFMEKCVAYEIEFHYDAFMLMHGFRGYIRNVATMLYTKKQLISHCRVIDISTDDISNLKQRLMFGYRRGVRPELKFTRSDPFRKERLISDSAALLGCAAAAFIACKDLRGRNMLLRRR